MPDWILQVSALEWVAVIAGLAYVILAARENIWCWPAAFVGTSASMLLLWDVSLLMDAALNLFYLIMAIYGYWQWRYGGLDQTQKAITTWRKSTHIKVFIAIAVLTLCFGYLLDQYTDAAWSYVDSATTWSAVIVTYMVTQKVLENWLYWIVIDAVSVWIYIERGIYLYAILFALYTIIAILGYLAWRRSFQAAHQS
ncbi:MAG: nicotinamide riboside transporter PnuC [Pseudomonadota bacterium]